MSDEPHEQTGSAYVRSLESYQLDVLRTLAGDDPDGSAHAATLLVDNARVRGGALKASHWKLAHVCQTNATQVQRALSPLERRGWIRVTATGGRKRGTIGEVYAITDTGRMALSIMERQNEILPFDRLQRQQRWRSVRSHT